MAQKEKKKFEKEASQAQNENEELKQRLGELLQNAGLMKNKLEEFSEEIFKKKFFLCLIFLGSFITFNAL